MREYQKVNFSLLTQKEIDVLVGFLTHNDFLESDVLNQSSIDKLVALILGDSATAGNIMLNSEFRKDKSELCVLGFEIDSSGFIKLFATNKDTGMVSEITPETFDEEEKSTGWGCVMSPADFNHLACYMDLKYSEATYTRLCELFAEKNFGSKEAHLPTLYLPTGEQHKRALL